MIEKLEPLQGLDHSWLNKINELVDAVNELQTKVNKLAPNINFAQPEVKENMRPPYMQNKRLRKALGIAQSALVKLANDAYDMDEHIYIDKILNQIERITKGRNND